MNTTDKLAAERAAFEAWAIEVGADVSYWLDRPETGYANGRVMDYWTGWQARAALEAEAKPAPAEPQPEPSCGWEQHAKWLEEQVNHYAQRIDAIHRHQQPEPDVWYWQGDGEDHLESMAASLPVVIRADALRAMLAAPAAPAMPNPGSPEASAMIDSVLAEYNWPSNTKNAARAGYVAATRLMAAPAAPAPDPEGTKCLTHEAIAAALTEGRPLNHMQRACLLGLVDADKRKQTCYDAAIQDAERYRWLRDQWDRADALEQVMLSNSADGKTWVGGGVLDQRIDAAIAASIGKGGAA